VLEFKRFALRSVPTNEELMIAQDTAALVKNA
jgi:acetate kinase